MIEEEVNEEESEVPQPQVTSSDPEERKLARRLRIQYRIEAIKKKNEPVVKADIEETEIEDYHNLLEKQIEQSATTLEQLLIEGEEIVTNVKIGNDKREVLRREKDTKRRDEIYTKLETEANEAEKRYQEIFQKWNVIAKVKDPLDLSESIANQKILCDELITQKDEIIRMLREEINVAEKKYVQEQEAQEQDITALCKRIDDQVDLMKKAYRNELKLIEQAIQTERQMTVEASDKKWELLQCKRNEEDEENMKKKIRLADEFLNTFNATRIEHEEKFRMKRIQMERETENLQAELEHLKAACLLNGEKLDYNYNILKKREDENLIIRAQQKRIINKLQDEINKIRRNMQEYREKSSDIITRLNSDIKQIRDWIFQIDRKAESICRINDKKFQEVWALNEESVRNELEKILNADKIIYEQLLGLEWRMPMKNVIKKENLPSVKDALETLNAQAKEGKPKVSTINYDETEKYTKTILKDILDKVAYRSGFLIEKDLQTILPKLPTDDQNLIKVDSVFDALGIKNDEDFRFMIRFFLPYANCPQCDASTLDTLKDKIPVDGLKSIAFQVQDDANPQEEDASIQETSESASELLDINLTKTITETPTIVRDVVTAELEENRDDITEESSTSASVTSSESQTEQFSNEFIPTTTAEGKTEMMFKATCKFNHPLRIEHINVYKILKDFVSAFNYNFNEVITMQKKVSKRYLSLSRLMCEEDIKIFWHQFGMVFSQYHEELWNEILYGLKKYHGILADRTRIYEKVKLLRRENAELKDMLLSCTSKEEKNKHKKKKRQRSKSTASSLKSYLPSLKSATMSQLH